MNAYKEQKTIRTVYADINGDGHNEKIVLSGMQLENNCDYIQDITISIEFKDGIESEYNIHEKGISFNMFTVDVTNSKSDEILLVGNYNKYGSFSTIKIFKFEENDLVLIFDNKECDNKINYKTKYLDDYKVEILCEETNEPYIIDINNLNKQYINNNYKDNGNVTNTINNIRCSIDNVFPVKLPENDYYSLLIQHGFRVEECIEKLGGVQTLVDIHEDGALTILDQYLMKKS